jgi:hypothetical protein
MPVPVNIEDAQNGSVKTSFKEQQSVTSSASPSTKKSTKHKVSGNKQVKTKLGIAMSIMSFI